MAPFQFHFHSGRLVYNWSGSLVSHMSTSIDTIRVRSGERDRELEGGVVDVTEVALQDLDEFVGEESVHLERHNGRTYVVADR